MSVNSLFYNKKLSQSKREIRFPVIRRKPRRCSKFTTRLILQCAPVQPMCNVYFYTTPDPLQVFPDALHKCYLFLLGAEKRGKGLFEIWCKTIIYNKNPLAPAQRPQLATYSEFIFTPSDGLAKGLQPWSGGRGVPLSYFQDATFYGNVFRRIEVGVWRYYNFIDIDIMYL